ncbi:MAG: protein kinase [Rhodothermales bacterium]|nr:protein kinase [Rhodothermales bacterium]
MVDALFYRPGAWSARGLGDDVLGAARTLRRSPGFAATVVVTLGFGVGGSTIMYGVAHDVLLRADAEAESEDFLGERLASAPPGDGAPEGPPAGGSLEGAEVGPYRVLRPLGRGGMGDVYLAVREAPFRQYVALKVIRRGMDTRDVLARFATERQILAALNHPGVARLLDGGVTAEGLPYFAMEYVEGRPLMAYCDDRRLPLEERLALFRAVCEAVHYAHQNLVLHRDLKPSNILITEDEHGEPQAKLLDFGIAKLLNPQLGGLPAPVTREAQRLLTPEYASPEQVRGEPLTTASDVYALGVLLYELLTGHRPYQLETGSAPEIETAVTEQDPLRPSTAVARSASVPGRDGTAGARVPTAVAAARATTPGRLRRRLRGDLDTICLMALRKEPNRRYASAEALAEDVERFLAGRPVHAHRDSRAYRLRKLLRRRPVEATALAALAVLLVGSAVYTGAQNRRVERERDRARTEAARAEQVAGFLVGLLEQGDPTAAPGEPLTVREILDDGAERVETELAGQPEVQGQVLAVVARAYAHLGAPDRAAALMARAHGLLAATRGRSDSVTTQALYDLAHLRASQERFAEAEALFRACADDVRARTGEHHPSVLRATYRVWEMLHHQRQRAATDSLFAVLVEMERALPPGDDPDHAFTLTQMGHVLRATGRAPEAEAYYRRALAMERRLHPGEHPRVAFLLSRVAGILNAQERFDEAEAPAREAVAMNARLFPEGHEQAASGHFNLGVTLTGLGRTEEAEGHLREAITMLEGIHGPDHRWLAVYRRALDELASGPMIAPHGQVSR